MTWDEAARRRSEEPMVRRVRVEGIRADCQEPAARATSVEQVALRRWPEQVDKGSRRLLAEREPAESAREAAPMWAARPVERVAHQRLSARVVSRSLLAREVRRAPPGRAWEAEAMLALAVSAVLGGMAEAGPAGA
jgi:hypothetical protein